MSRNINPFGLRMPPELNESIEKAAKENGRSKNAEIIYRLEQSFYSHDKPLDHDEAVSINLRKEELAEYIKQVFINYNDSLKEKK